MAEQPSNLRFDHREIAVIFALFVFISLLMFTVGIVVGKGLTLAKFEGKVPVDIAHFDAGAHAPAYQRNTGTSVSTQQPPSYDRGRLPSGYTENSQTSSPKPEPDGDFKPIPKKSDVADILSRNLLEPELTKENLDSLLNNPQIRDLLDSDELSTSAKRAKRTPRAKPRFVVKSFARGKYTVQVGSFPDRKIAEERVASLKRLGFKNSYLSAATLPSKKITFRVWLGYYPNQKSAQRNAKYLKKLGEVESYLVRKAS